MTRILIVDDDRDILGLLRLEFEDEPGCSADTANDVHKALELVRVHPYDLIITDWRMPVMNGTEFVGAVRNQGCTTPIALYSGKECDQEIRDALDAGAEWYVGRRGNPEQEFPELKRIVQEIASRTKKPGSA
jgi:Response regulator containing CheY-like receiver, AAA-type ATPase, and DNA-binding domains